MSLRWRTNIPHFLLILPGLFLFGGCKSFETTKDIGYYTVIAKKTRVYRFGPGQVSAGDTTLSEGQRVVLLRREIGYSRVLTPDGEKGFVLSNTIQPARPEPGAPRIPNAIAQLPRGSSSPSVSAANRAVLQSGALFENNEVLPLPQDPDAGLPSVNQGPKSGAKKKPGFRITNPKPSTPETGPTPEGE